MLKSLIISISLKLCGFDAQKTLLLLLSMLKIVMKKQTFILIYNLL